MSASRHLSKSEFHRTAKLKRLTKKQKGHESEPSFSHRKSLVGFRPETRLGARQKHPGGLVPPDSDIAKPGTYVLHAPKPRVYHNVK